MHQTTQKPATKPRRAHTHNNMQLAHNPGIIYMCDHRPRRAVHRVPKQTHPQHHICQVDKLIRSQLYTKLSHISAASSHLLRIRSLGGFATARRRAHHYTVRFALRSAIRDRGDTIKCILCRSGAAAAAADMKGCDGCGVPSATTTNKSIKPQSHHNHLGPVR